MIVLTDGHSNNYQATLNATSRAKSLGIRLFSVGIGSNLNDAELMALAGGDRNNLYYVPNWDDLKELLTKSSADLCPNASSG
jgi:secreted protein with Ig-like and vWFA domain